MNSVPTEITELAEGETNGSGWIFYDRDCSSCSELAVRFAGVFAKRSFRFVPLQEQWAQERLGLSAAEMLAEMRVLSAEGEVHGGADAVIFLAQQVWWMSPLSWLAKLPGARARLRAIYRWVASHRTCAIPTSAPGVSLPRRAWLPLLVLPIFTFAAKPLLPAWGFMWAMAFAIFFGCKWLTLSLARLRLPAVRPFRAAAYLLAWPGMDAPRFLHPFPTAPLPANVFIKAAAAAILRTTLGFILLFGVARHATHPLLAGWLGMIALVLVLHFGSFDLISLAWRKLRIDAPPIMNAPVRSTSVAEFWGERWNAAFNQLATRFVFRPIARRYGPALATLAAFGASGFVHELVISVPASGGYGLPTAYFLLQGAALLIERRLGHSRLFTIVVVAGPAFWLFHPAFVERVVLPFMQTIGAL